MKPVLAVLIVFLFVGCAKPKVIAVCGSGQITESDNDTVIPTSNSRIYKPTEQGVVQNCQTIINPPDEGKATEWLMVDADNSGAIVACDGKAKFGTVEGVCPDGEEVNETFNCPGVSEIDPCPNANGSHFIDFIYGNIIETVEFSS